MLQPLVMTPSFGECNGKQRLVTHANKGRSEEPDERPIVGGISNYLEGQQHVHDFAAIVEFLAQERKMRNPHSCKCRGVSVE